MWCEVEEVPVFVPSDAAEIEARVAASFVQLRGADPDVVARALLCAWGKRPSRIRREHVALALQLPRVSLRSFAWDAEDAGLGYGDACRRAVLGGFRACLVVESEARIYRYVGDHVRGPLPASATRVASRALASRGGGWLWDTCPELGGRISAFTVADGVAVLVGGYERDAEAFSRPPQSVRVAARLRLAV
ncbi:MAG: hypothetical protein RID81_06865 [Sandaracinaceae bacterium]